MKTSQKIFFLLMLVALVWSAGCTTVNTFSTIARAGDTVAIPLGWQFELTRDNLQITFTDSSTAMFVYLPGDPAVRGILNSYPDPISNLIVGTETGQTFIDGSNAGIASTLIEGTVTAGDKEYVETLLLLDLPLGLATGTATIEVADALGNPIPNPNLTKTNIDPIFLEVIAGAGSSNTLANQELIGITPAYFKSMERTPHFTVNLLGATIPYSVQLNMSHDADLDNSGTGKAYVASSRGDIKTMNWTDDGFNLQVIIMPAKSEVLTDMKHFKFYVAGGITGLVVNSVDAVDINGNPVAGVTWTVD